MADRGKQQQRIRKSYRNFILSRISQLQKDEAFVDVRLTNGQGKIVNAHKIVLAGLSALLKEALASTTLNYEEDLEPNVTIIIPDFDMKTLEYFVLLSYGLASPPAVMDLDLQESILELCQLLGLAWTSIPIVPMATTPPPTASSSQVPPDFQELDKFTTEKPGPSVEEVTTEDVERLLKAIEPEKVVLVEDASRTTGFGDILKCPECNQKFVKEKDLAFHQQAHHHRPLTFFCSICRKPFDKETSLRHHKIAAHHEGTKTKLNCAKCGGKFTGKSALSKHVTYCDGKNTLDCHICGKVYARKDNLVNHLARHSGVQLQCEHCQKSFRTSNDLYKHKKRLHAEASGLKSAYVVSCDQCGRKFTDKGRAYKDHLDYHKGIKNYECHTCDKRFATAASLREHASQHSGLNTHACKICRKEFKRVQNVRQHLIWTHKIRNEENVRVNIERLFLSGVDKLRALKRI